MQYPETEMVATDSSFDFDDTSDNDSDSFFGSQDNKDTTLETATVTLGLDENIIEANFFVDEIVTGKTEQLLDFSVEEYKMSVWDILNCFPYLQSDMVMPNLNHHFVSDDSLLDSLLHSVIEQIQGGTYTLNDKIWVIPYTISNDSTGLDLYSITGTPLQELYGSNGIQGVAPTAIIMRSFDKTKIDANMTKQFNDPKHYHDAYCYFAPVDGCHRLYLLAQLLVNGLPNGKKMSTSKMKKMTFNVNVLLPKKALSSDKEVILRAKEVSLYFAEMTRKGKGHTLWDSLYSALCLIENTLPENAMNNGMTSRFLARPMKCKIHRSHEFKHMPGFLFSTDQEELFCGLIPILPNIIMELIKFEQLAMDWRLHHKIKKESDILVPLDMYKDATKCLNVLTSLVTFIGSSKCKQYIADPTRVARFKTTGVELPFSILQILHLLITASMSHQHLKTVKNCLEKMMKNNTLTLERLLIIISYADDIASKDCLLNCNRHPKHSKKVRKIVHGSLVMSALKTYSLDDSAFDTDLNHLSKEDELCGYLRSYSNKWYDKLSHDQLRSVPDNFIKWDHEKDIFITLHTTYLLNVIEQPWFHNNMNSFLLPMTRQIVKKLKITINDLDIPEYMAIELQNKKEKVTIPFSVSATYQFLFDLQQKSIDVSPHWLLHDFEKLNKNCFSMKSKKGGTKRKKDNEIKQWIYTDNVTTLKDFESQIIDEFWDKETTKTRRLCLATTFLTINGAIRHNDDSFEQMKKVVESLDNGDNKPLYPDSILGHSVATKKRKLSLGDDDDSDSDITPIWCHSVPL
mmetsp:Transcript_12422/g.23295  ORF Transcript_12422/g.23295 Transcript_12422/m.23295 type:complete len:799 (-) Transcript_12422:249-2645(-)